MKITNLKRRIAATLVAGGMCLGMASGASAVSITVPDQGFEDHVIDDPSGYAYGAAGQAGDPDGWNNLSSDSNLSSPWQSANTFGNGIDGSEASFMITAAYNAASAGLQAMESQGPVLQPLADTYLEGAYTLTVAAMRSSASSLDMVFYDANLTPPTNANFVPDALNSGLTTVAVPGASDDGIFNDVSVVFQVPKGSPLIGNVIGIGVDSVGVSGVVVDDVRLDFVAGPGFDLGDFDGNGSIGVEDYNIMRANWHTGAAPFLNTFGDVTGDFLVDIADFKKFKEDLFPGGASAFAEALAAASAVPEPSTVMLLLAAAPAWLSRRFRDRKK